MRVIHKGLIVVGVPLALELLVIGTLAYLLNETDRSYTVESMRSKITLNGARLVFADCKAGCLLIRSWKQQDPSALASFHEQCQRLDELAKVLTYTTPDDDPRIRKSNEDCWAMQNRVTGYLRRIAELTSDGFDLGTLKEVIKLRKALVLELDQTFRSLRDLYRTSDAVMEAARAKLTMLQQAEYLVVAIGFATNVLVAGLLLAYYRRNFITPIKVIEANVKRLAQNQPLSQPLGGSDEISELDRAFHEMNSELVLAAEREKSLFNNSSDVICALDLNLNIARINDAAAKLWLRNPAELIGTSVFSVLSASEQASGMFNKSRSEGRPVTFEQPVIKGDSETVESLWSVFWSEQQQSWYCIVTDISVERKLAQVRRAFLKLIVADFQQPLHRMSFLLSSLMDKSLPDAVKGKLTNASSTLKRMVGLVDDLLELETMQTTDITLNPSTVKVASLLAQSVADTESLARDHKIDVEVACDSALTCHADADKIVRVIVNFLSNALKFSPESSRVSIAAVSDGENVTISVIDRGRGIAAENIKQLFQPFQQTQSADGKRGKGTGLGLVVCKRIVEQHGGAVGVDSVLGQGSTFWLRIPLHARVAVQNAVVRQDVHPVSSDAFDQQSSVERAPVPLVEKEAPKPAQKRSSKMDLTLKQKAVLLIGVPLVFEAVFVSAMMFVLSETGAELSRLLSGRAVVSAGVRMTMNAYDAALLARDAPRLKFDEKRFNESLNYLPVRIEAFEKLAPSDPLSADYAPKIIRKIKYIQGQLHAFVKITQEDANLTPHQLANASDYLFMWADNLGDAVQEMVNAFEARERTSPERQKALRLQQAALLFAGLLLNVALGAGLAVFVARDMAGRLKVMADNSRRLAEGALLNAPVAGSDEIAMLDQAFHQTAQQVSGERAKERAFLDYSPSIICAFDENGNFIAVNPASARLLGQPPEALLLKPLKFIVLPESQDAVIEALARTKESSEPYRLETRVARARAHGNDQGLETELADLQWSLTWSEKEKSFFAVAHDITSRKELERMKKEFLALITHDLRTPLTTIFGMMGLALAGALGPITNDVKMVVSEVQFEADQILELVNDLLDMEKLEAGQLKLELATVDLSKVVESARELAANRLSGKIQLDVEVNGNAGVDADFDRLAHALASLLIEGRTASSSLKLLLQRQPSGVQVNMICQGSRQNPELVQRVIQQMESGEVDSDERRGSRLRLPLARSILKSHNASVQVLSDSHGDLSILITMPLSAAATVH